MLANRGGIKLDILRKIMKNRRFEGDFEGLEGGESGWEVCAEKAGRSSGKE